MPTPTRDDPVCIGRLCGEPGVSWVARKGTVLTLAQAGHGVRDAICIVQLRSEMRVQLYTLRDDSTAARIVS